MRVKGEEGWVGVRVRGRVGRCEGSGRVGRCEGEGSGRVGRCEGERKGG